MERTEHRRTPWRDNLEAGVMAVVMALFLKCFVIEAYKIPTGSMQPTLIGDEKADVKDRILVDKLSYAFRDPERWEVAVFRYPLDRSKSFVKRIAGVGPEELRIQYGDLWHRVEGGSWSIARRPRSVLESVWKPLEPEDGEDSHWIPRNLPTSSHWQCLGRAIEARGSGTVAYRGGHEPITDGYLDGYPEELLPWLPTHHKESDRNPVGDLRVSGRIRALEGLESFVLVLREGARGYRFELPGPASAADAEVRIVADAYAVAPDELLPPAARPYRLPAGRAVRFTAQNLDDRLELELEGDLRLALEIAPAEDQDSSVALTLEGAGADLSELMVARDIYYSQEGTQSVHVPAGCYYMLGDNTQDSSDSREWTFATFEARTADGGWRSVRGNWRDRENPRAVGLGEPEGPFTYLVDEFGERSWWQPGEVRRGDPEPAPFVPRSMILGKALAVFWPLDPLRDIWRLEWVN